MLVEQVLHGAEPQAVNGFVANSYQILYREVEIVFHCMNNIWRQTAVTQFISILQKPSVLM